jgi:integrase
MKLTKTAVDAAKPAEKKYLLLDSLVPGLRLLVLPSGVKTYYVRFRTLEGRQLDFKLGSPVELTPDDARRLAREALAQSREGKDPQRDRQEKRQGQTMDDLSTEYMERHGRKKRQPRHDLSLWQHHLLPAFGKRKVLSLSHEEVAEWHEKHPQPWSANRALALLSKAMNLAERWKWKPANTNPCKGVERHPEPKRKRYLKPDELERLRVALDAWEASLGSIQWRFARMVRLLLLTGARLRNIMEARWEWVDWERKMIVVPLEHHKTGKDSQEPLQVHLGDRGLELLQEVRRAQNEHTPWIISGEQLGKPLVGYRKLWLALLRDAQITALRVHDLRHSFASYMLDEGESLKAVGEILGHASSQTTDRYAHLLDDGARRAVSKVSARLGV